MRETDGRSDGPVGGTEPHTLWPGAGDVLGRHRLGRS